MEEKDFLREYRFTDDIEIMNLQYNFKKLGEKPESFKFGPKEN